MCDDIMVEWGCPLWRIKVWEGRDGSRIHAECGGLSVVGQTKVWGVCSEVVSIPSNLWWFCDLPKVWCLASP